MSNARKNNVLIIDTGAQFDEELCIESIKIVNGGGSAATSTLKVGGSSGTTVYTNTVAANSEEWEDVRIQLQRGDAAYFTPGTSCTFYVYLK